MSIVCPACQTANPSAALFCGQCGGALRAAAGAGETPFHGERRQLTALFCDIVNSTAIAKALDPEEYHEVLRAFVRCCTAVVAPLGGHVAELRGDGALVFFGYPRSHGDEPERAIRAALGIIEAVSGERHRLRRAAAGAHRCCDRRDGDRREHLGASPPSSARRRCWRRGCRRSPSPTRS